MGAAGSQALKTAQMSCLFGRFVEGEGVAYLETAQLSGFGFLSLKQAPVLQCWLAGLKTAEK